MTACPAACKHLLFGQRLNTALDKCIEDSGELWSICHESVVMSQNRKNKAKSKVDPGSSAGSVTSACCILNSNFSDLHLNIRTLAFDWSEAI